MSTDDTNLKTKNFELILGKNCNIILPYEESPRIAVVNFQTKFKDDEKDEQEKEKEKDQQIIFLPSHPPDYSSAYPSQMLIEHPHLRHHYTYTDEESSDNDMPELEEEEDDEDEQIIRLPHSVNNEGEEEEVDDQEIIRLPRPQNDEREEEEHDIIRLPRPLNDEREEEEHDIIRLENTYYESDYSSMTPSRRLHEHAYANISRIRPLDELPIRIIETRLPAWDIVQEHVDSCCICLTLEEDTQPYICLRSCKHTFHEKCITTWLSKMNTCPSCRTVVH